MRLAENLYTTKKTKTRSRNPKTLCKMTKKKSVKTKKNY